MNCLNNLKIYKVLTPIIPGHERSLSSVRHHYFHRKFYQKQLRRGGSAASFQDFRPERRRSAEWGGTDDGDDEIFEGEQTRGGGYSVCGFQEDRREQIWFYWLFRYLLYMQSSYWLPRTSSWPFQRKTSTWPSTTSTQTIAGPSPPPNWRTNSASIFPRKPIRVCCPSMTPTATVWYIVWHIDISGRV